MRIRELVFESKQPDLIQVFRDFLPIAMKELGINKLPKIDLCLQVPEDHQPTFGKYVNEENKIYLAIENRHPIDIARTLAHELAHYKQELENKLSPTSGETGSPVENQAHEVAGVIMRHFDKKFPNHFKDRAVDIEA